MKKLLFLFSFSLIFFACDDNKKDNDDDTNPLLASRRIPQQKAHDMKQRFKTAGKEPTKYTFDWAFYHQLATGAPDDDVFIIPVRYSQDDEEEYRRVWGIPNGDPAGQVRELSSFIIQVGTNSRYYTFVQICPPPYDDDGNCGAPSDSSSTSTILSRDSLKTDSLKIKKTKK